MNILKRLNGHSGNLVFLVEKSNNLFVQKVFKNDPIPSIEILEKLPFHTPKILEINDNSVLMEYIPGQDMKTYLLDADSDKINKITEFIIDYINFCLSNSAEYDFKKELDNKVEYLQNFIDLSSFRKNIPNKLPKSLIHGDFNLENIVYHQNKFYLIDAHYTDLNSVYFDINKLRIDLEAFWFLREFDTKIYYEKVCRTIKNILFNEFKDAFNDNMYALMLGRVLPYCNRDLEKNLILSELKKIEPN